MEDLKILILIVSTLSLSHAQTYQDPYITTPYGITEGTDASLSCIAVGIGANVSLSWRRTSPNTPIAAGTSCSPIPSTSAYSCSSVITLSPTRNDNGAAIYCTASQEGNPVSTDSSPSMLTVWVTPPPEYPEITGPDTVVAGESNNWTCTADGAFPTATLSWRIGASSATQTSTEIPEVNNADNTIRAARVLVRTLNSNDNGQELHCDMTHDTLSGSPRRVSKVITVQYAPIITIPATSYTSSEGVAQTLVCNIDAVPTPTVVQWFKDGVALDRAVPGKYIGGSTANPSLEIRNSDADDAGTYVCSATNSVDSTEGNPITLTVEYTPVVVIPGSEYTATRSNSLTIPCTVTANPSVISVRWEATINSLTVGVDMGTPGSKYTGSTATTPALTINNIQPTDVGQYQCIAINAIATGSSNLVDVAVVYTPRNVQITPPAVDVSESNSVTVTCSAEAEPAPTYDWYFEDSDIVYFTGASLMIPAITRAQDGIYKCVASNNLGNSTALVDIRVNYAPVLTTSSSPQTVVEGDQLTLTCTIDATPSPYTITWKRNNVDVDRTSGRVSGGLSVSDPNLTITNAESADEGLYTCTVNNNVGTTVSSGVDVQVIFEPRNIAIAPATDVILNEGDAQTLTCTADGDPTPAFQWTAQSTVIATGSSLVIASAGSQDNREVTCEASNSVGSVSMTKTITVYYTPLVAIPGGTAFGADEGESLTIPCLVDANPDNFTVTWLRDSAVLDLSNSSKYGGGTRESRNLTIFSLGSSDAGNYSCQADNTVGQGTSREVLVTISYKPENVQLDTTTVDVNEGDQILVTCAASAAPSPTFSWWKAGAKIQDGATLNVTSVSPADAGMYTCQATNDKGTTSISIVADISYAPRVNSSVSEVSDDLGEDLTIPCEISAKPNITDVVWYVMRDSSEEPLNITYSSGKYEGGSVSHPSLIIKNVTNSDIGQYRCQATNPLGSAMGPYVAVVLSSPPTAVSFSPTTATVNEGETIQVTCSAGGAPAPSYVWYRGGEEYSTGPQLIILSATAADINNYTCVASNDQGTQQSTIGIDVTYRPEGQTDIIVTATIGSAVTLTCSNQANPAATSYEWYFNGVTLNGTSINLIVTPTQDSDFGTYTCRATNNIGTSDLIPVSLQKRNEGESTAAAGLSTPILILLILLIIIIIIVIIVIIVILYKKGKICKKRKEPKVAPKPAPKPVPAVSEKPEPIANSGMRIDDEKYANGTLENKPTDGGTIISIPTDVNPVPHHLPPMEATHEKKKRRRKKKKRPTDEENPEHAESTIREDEEEE